MPARLAKSLLIVATSLAAVTVGELVLRWWDGYRVVSVALRRDRPVPEAGDGRAGDLKYVGQIPVAPGVERAWYAHEPDRASRRDVDPELERRASEYPSDGAAPFFSFNRRYLQQQACETSRAAGLPPFMDFFYFDPIEASPYPTYRHLRHVSPPGWFVTNNFGWRGHDVALNRPAGVIRIAFVGASTTVDSYGVPFSHPELVEYWLNAWASSTHRPYSFEVINAGRSGIDSRSIAAVVRQELLPVDPDLVVFYEGANQFWPGQMMDFRFGRLYPRPARTFRQRLAAENYSAVVRRVLSLFDRFTGQDGREPRKPPYTLRWPESVNERDPDVFSDQLPMDLTQVVSDLESMRRALSARGGELAVSSFVWLVHDGLQLDLTRHLQIYRYLNDSYWPITYALMRRMADFQNRVFEKYANSQRLPFIDIAARFPQDPNLFSDAIHMSYPGLRLQAWLLVQALVPIVLAHTDAGTWPRPAPQPAPRHPAFDQPDRRLIRLSALKASCS